MMTLAINWQKNTRFDKCGIKLPGNNSLQHF